MMNTSRSGSPVKENKGQGLWPRVVKEDGFHLKNNITRREKSMLIEMKRRKHFWKTFNSGDFTEKKILPDTKKGVRQ